MSVGERQWRLMERNRATQAFRQLATMSNNDGIILHEDFTPLRDSGTHYMVLLPNQIKSAIGNVGSFNRASNDIRKSFMKSFMKSVDEPRDGDGDGYVMDGTPDERAVVQSVDDTGDLREGDVVTIPQSHSSGEFQAELIDAGERWQVRMVGSDTRGWMIRKELLPRMLADLGGNLPYASLSANYAIDKALIGQSPLVGQGNGGMVFDGGDHILKASSIVPFHWVNGLRSLNQANEKLQGEIDVSNKLNAAGVAGILPLTPIMHEGRLYATRERVELEGLTQDHINQAGEALEQMHSAGFMMRDMVQIGVGTDDRFRFFDVGEAGALPTVAYDAKYRMEEDHDSLVREAKKVGLKYIPPEDRNPLPKFTQSLMSMQTAMSHDAPDYLELWSAKNDFKDKWRRLLLNDPNMAEAERSSYELWHTAAKDMMNNMKDKRS